LNYVSNLSREQRREQIEKYLSLHPDATLKQIGNLLGVTKQRAHILLKREGIQTRVQRTKQFVIESETEILRYIASGNTSKQIAVALGVSQWTIDRSVKIILTKLKAQNRAQAVILAKRQGLI